VLATEHALPPLYRTWFIQRLPTGERLGIDISPQLEASFKRSTLRPGPTTRADHKG
jgi:glutamate/aspartate transport system substrate-binding protein